MTKIVRKVDPSDGEVCAFWVNDAGRVLGWWDENTPGRTPEEEAASGDEGGWEVLEGNALAICGCSLAALRAELEAPE